MVPAVGNETSSLPSGVHAASRAPDCRAHTDIDHPAGTSACRGLSKGAWSMVGGTVTDVATRCDGVGGGAVQAGGGVDEHAAISSAVASAAALRRQDGMHLPDEDLSRIECGDPLSAGGGEPHGVALVQGTGPFEGDLSERHIQMQIGGVG